MVPLKIVDPPQCLKEQWDEALKECGHNFLRILIDHHKSQISFYEEMAHDKINQASDIIIPEFVSNIPEIGENFEEAIENLIMETNRITKKLKPFTRPNKNPPQYQRRKRNYLNNKKSQRREEGNPQKFEREISKIAQKKQKKRIRQQYLKRIYKIDNIHNTYRRLHNLSN